MPKSRASGHSRSAPAQDEADRAPPDREAVERAIESIVDRLTSNPPAPKLIRARLRPSNPRIG